MTQAVTSQVVILDYGSQYTQLITRRVREVEVYSILLPGDATFKRVFEENKPTAIILSGGPNSVHVKGAPSVPDGFWEECEKRQIPVRDLLRDATDRALLGRESGWVRER